MLGLLLLAVTVTADVHAPPPPLCAVLRLQNGAVTAAFDGCTGALTELTRRGAGGANLLAGATTAPDRGPWAIWVDAPPPWIAVNALNRGTDALDKGARSCSGRAGCVALPNNGTAPLTAASCRLVSHELTFRSTIPTLTMVLVPKIASLPLRITLTATFSAAGADPRLLLTLSVANTGTAPLSLQTALPYLRGVRLSAGNASDLGLQHIETGVPGSPAWGGCGGHGATTDSCGGLLGYHQSSQWQQVYAADGSQGLAVIVHDATGAPRMWPFVHCSTVIADTVFCSSPQDNDLHRCADARRWVW